MTETYIMLMQVICYRKLYIVFTCAGTNSICHNAPHCHDIEIYYHKLVHCLTFAAEHSIPQIPNSALKHYWSVARDDLKQDSVDDAHNLWVSAGRPRSRSIFYLMKRYKYRFKLAVKDSAHAFENKYSDDLFDIKGSTKVLENLESQSVQQKTYHSKH